MPGSSWRTSAPTPSAPKPQPGSSRQPVGICAGVTALPVLGAILLQMGLLRQRLGQLALACAAINDALLWIFLAGLLAYGAEVAGRHVLAGARGWATLPGARVRPRPPSARPNDNEPRTKEAGPGSLGLAAACATALGSAAATEALGLHHVLGAFLAGVAMPGAARRASWYGSRPRLRWP